MRAWNTLGAASAGLIALLALVSGCSSAPETVELNGVEVSALDRGARWLAHGIDETRANEDLSPEEQRVIVEYLTNVMADATLRGDRGGHDAFLADLQSDGYPNEAIVVAEAALVRASSRLNHHEGVWMAVVENPKLPRPIELVNDVRIDAWTMRVTVYAQQRVGRRILAPAQVGPGEFVERPNGETVGFHPNAVYLDGSGKEYSEDVGGGAWWVKHSWVLGGEGYNNWQLGETDYSRGGQYVEGRLLEDGLTMEMSASFTDADLERLGLTAEDVEGDFYGNIRIPVLDTDPVTYEVTRYEPANLDAGAGPIDPTSTPTFTLTLDFAIRPSPFDGLSRGRPVGLD
jgi:hypothetical protein